ncbi:hypothetical protein Tco_1494835 [Tanacetum coccineum]
MEAIYFSMHLSKSQSEHIDEFHNIVGDLKLKDVLATLNSRELQKMTEAKGDGGKGFHKEEAADSDQVSGFGADEYDSVDVMMAMSVEELLDWIMDSGGSYHITYRRDYLVDFEEYDGGNILLGDGRECRRVFTVKMQLGKIKVIRGSLVVLSGTRRANCIYTMDGQPVITKTLKGRKQLGEYQTGWKIKTGDVLDSCNQKSTQQYTKSRVARHLGIAGIQQQNGSFWAEDTTMSTYLVDRSPSSAIRFKAPVDMLGFFGWLASIKQRMLEPVKVKCIFLGYHEGIVGNKLWRLDDVTLNVVLYRNMGFNESGGYKKTFIGSGVGMGSVQVLQGVEFEVEPREDHAFEVEPLRNVGQGAGS